MPNSLQNVIVFIAYTEMKLYFYCSNIQHINALHWKPHILYKRALIIARLKCKKISVVRRNVRTINGSFVVNKSSFC